MINAHFWSIYIAARISQMQDTNIECSDHVAGVPPLRSQCNALDQVVEVTRVDSARLATDSVKFHHALDAERHHCHTGVIPVKVDQATEHQVVHEGPDGLLRVVECPRRDAPGTIDEKDNVSDVGPTESFIDGSHLRVGVAGASLACRVSVRHHPAREHHAHNVYVQRPSCLRYGEHRSCTFNVIRR